LDTPAFREILCPNQIQCPGLLRPRCLSAWYVTRIAAGIIHLEHTFPLPVNRTSTWRLGSDVLASIAYPGIAFTHFSVKLIVASRGKGSYTETQADIFVLESATKLAMVITCHQQPRTLTKNFNWIYFWFGFLFVPIWSAFYSNYLDGPWTSARTFGGLIISNTSTPVIQRLEVRYLSLEIRVLTGFLQCHPLHLLALSPTIYSCASKFTDLDQLAAFGSTLLVLLYS